MCRKRAVRDRYENLMSSGETEVCLCVGEVEVPGRVINFDPITADSGPVAPEHTGCVTTTEMEQDFIEQQHRIDWG